MRKLFTALAAAMIAAIVPLKAVHAQADFPSRPVKIIVPYQAGSAPDSYVRFVGQRLAEALKQPVVVDNKPGAGGVIGGEALAKAAPDGYTLGYISIQHLANKYLMRSMPFDVIRDLQPIQMFGVLPQVVVVAVENPAKSLGEFVQQARARPYPVTFGSGGSGSPAHLAGHALATAGDFKSTHVAYKGSPESLTALIGGQIDYLVTTSATSIPLIKAGKIRALAITSARRTDLLPGIPTVAEALPAGFVFEAWGMLMAPSKTPKAVIDRLAAAMQTAMHEPATEKFFAGTATSSETMPAGQLPEFVKAEDRKIARWIRDAGLKPE